MKPPKREAGPWSSCKRGPGTLNRETRWTNNGCLTLPPSPRKRKERCAQADRHKKIRDEERVIKGTRVKPGVVYPSSPPEPKRRGGDSVISAETKTTGKESRAQGAQNLNPKKRTTMWKTRGPTNHSDGGGKPPKKEMKTGGAGDEWLGCRSFVHERKVRAAPPMSSEERWRKNGKNCERKSMKLP